MHAVILLLFMPLIYCQYIYKWSENNVNYPSENRALKNHMVLELSSQHLVTQCSMKCIKNENCESFNFYDDSKICQLNKASHLEYPDDLIVQTGSKYLTRSAFTIDKNALGVCYSKPCLNSGTCLDTSDEGNVKSYYCACPELWKGKNCHIDVKQPYWNKWREKNPCSVTCGNGWRSDVRECLDGETDNVINPIYCSGADEQLKPCTLGPCPRWSEWTSWSKCSSEKYCGPGHQTRSRACENGGVIGVDFNCRGMPSQILPCDSISCQGPARLIGSKIYGSGVLEIFNDRTKQWGCVCDGNLSPEVFDVACKQMGLSGASVNVSKQYDVDSQISGIGFTWIKCGGDEQSLQSCDHSKWEMRKRCPNGWKPLALNCKVDGQWTKWSTWETCTVTCSNGLRIRRRECINPPPTNGGNNCLGQPTESKVCVKPACPVDAVFLEWSSWSRCSVTCSRGTKTRKRSCTTPLHGGRNCVGPKVDHSDCTERPCPVDGYWGEWSDWSSCAATCGHSSRDRVRKCHPPQHGGQDCEGPRFERDECFLVSCLETTWGQWTLWSECTSTCNTGVRTRSRICVYTDDGGNCLGPANAIQNCNEDPCPVDGKVTEWSSWSDCTAACGGGNQSRHRECVGRAFGGKDCKDTLNQSQMCNTHKCPVDGKLTEWSNWTLCSMTCGSGNHSRTRLCNGQAHGGRDCDGELNETRLCNTQPCPIDGIFSMWSNWTLCSESCGGGHQMRFRQCTGRAHGGRECSGQSNESQTCNQHPCPIDGKLSEWSTWTKCSVSCGGGSQDRQRQCLGRAHGGRDCLGPTNETRDCNEKNCPVDGYFKQWLEWGNCSATCGNGTQSRQRECVLPLHGGKPCMGETVEYQVCYQRPCPIPGDWLPWSSWSLCSKTCGGGLRERQRTCNVSVINEYTADCEGNTKETKTCHDFSCEPHASSCTELKQRGLEDSVVVNIDPENLDPFSVYCNLAMDSGIGVTIIGHDQEAEKDIVGYEGPGEYEVSVKYNATMKHMVSLIAVSSSCRQFIQWHCFGAVMHNPDRNNEQVTFWRNRTGIKSDYWGGAEKGSGKCACGMTNSCDNVNEVCNCDSNDAVWREDSGFITLSQDLPVTAFAAGDTGGLVDAKARLMERGRRVLGPLECQGVT